MKVSKPPTSSSVVLRRKTVPTVGFNNIFGKTLNGYYSIISMVVRTSVGMRALAQGVYIHFVQEFLTFADGKQAARCLSLASQSLQEQSLAQSRRSQNSFNFRIVCFSAQKIVQISFQQELVLVPSVINSIYMLSEFDTVNYESWAC